MFKIILVSHGSFSKGLLEATEFIAGKQENIEAYSLYLGDDIESFCSTIKEKIINSENNEGVLVLTDIQSGSPFNATVGAMENEKIRHITGMNMPMLLTVVCERPFSSLDEVCSHLIEESKKGIVDVNKLLEEIPIEMDEDE